MNTPSSHSPNHQGEKDTTSQQSLYEQPLEDKIKEITKDTTFNYYKEKLKENGIFLDWPSKTVTTEEELRFSRFKGYFYWMYNHVIRTLITTAIKESDISNVKYKEFLEIFHENILPNIELVREWVKIKVSAILLPEFRTLWTTNPSKWEEFTEYIFDSVISILSKEENLNKNCTQENNIHTWGKEQNPPNEAEQKQEKNAKPLKDTTKEFLQRKIERIRPRPMRPKRWYMFGP